jgi:hypothetical protein
MLDVIAVYAYCLGLKKIYTVTSLVWDHPDSPVCGFDFEVAPPDRAVVVGVVWNLTIGRPLDLRRDSQALA